MTIDKATKVLCAGLVCCAALLTSCSDIDEADRLAVVNVVNVDTIAPPEPEPQDTIDYFAPYQRHVLVEDFTGQNCVNCPNATDLIGTLQAMNGHDNVIAVGIHSGPLGVKKTDKTPEGLATTLGDTYYNYWKIDMQPYGVIDRSDGILPTDYWSAKVSYDLGAEQWPATHVNIFVNAEKAADSNDADISVTLAGVKGATSGKLQVWITEDAITAFQKMPDGTTKNDYGHSHVLRDAVNGDWGQDCQVKEGETAQYDYTYTLPAAWNAEQLAIVAFVYDDKQVLQVVRQKLKVRKNI